MKSEGKRIKVQFDDIEFIESKGEYAQVNLTDQTSILSFMSLKGVLDILPEESFMRVHRSFIVNLEKIKTIERNQIVYGKNKYVPISEQYKKEFKKFINDFFV